MKTISRYHQNKHDAAEKRRADYRKEFIAGKWESISTFAASKLISRARMSRLLSTD